MCEVVACNSQPTASCKLQTANCLIRSTAAAQVTSLQQAVGAERSALAVHQEEVQRERAVLQAQVGSGV